jgi:hypothetical protein
MFIVDRRSDADFEKERTYDPTTSETSKTISNITDGKIT